MGVEVLIAGAILSSLAGGVSAKREADKQADAAAIEGQEQQELRADEVRKQIARNTVLFAKSGISLEGSPLFGLEQDAKTGAADVDAIARNTRARVSSLKSGGRNALLGGVSSALGSGASLSGGARTKSGSK